MVAACHGKAWLWVPEMRPFRRRAMQDSSNDMVGGVFPRRSKTGWDVRIGEEITWVVGQTLSRKRNQRSGCDIRRAAKE